MQDEGAPELCHWARLVNGQCALCPAMFGWVVVHLGCHVLGFKVLISGRRVSGLTGEIGIGVT